MSREENQGQLCYSKITIFLATELGPSATARLIAEIASRLNHPVSHTYASKQLSESVLVKKTLWALRRFTYISQCLQTEFTTTRMDRGRIDYPVQRRLRFDTHWHLTSAHS
jgi:hypothetical protein